MPTSVADIEAQALELPPEERAHLADRLLASLGGDADLENAWSAEAERRLAELESGTVIAVPIEEAIARARNVIG